MLPGDVLRAVHSRAIAQPLYQRRKAFLSGGLADELSSLGQVEHGHHVIVVAADGHHELIVVAEGHCADRSEEEALAQDQQRRQRIHDSRVPHVDRRSPAIATKQGQYPKYPELLFKR